MATNSILRPAEPVAPVDVGEIVPLLFDFSEMAAGDTIAGAPVVTCEVLAGTDATPGARLNGSPTVSGGLQVVQLVYELQQGATYLVRCVATMASGLRYAQAMEVPCIRLGQTT